MQNKNSATFLLILIGSLCAFPPFTTDLYLPALPSLTVYFKTMPALVQTSLTMSMTGLALGQLFVGPLSDKFGRKKLLFISLICFFISTILCIISPSIGVFNTMRLIQGMSASGGVVIARSIATDKCRGKVLTKFLALASAINGIAPITAPVIGGIILTFVDWRGTFAILLLYGILLLLATLHLQESLPEHRRSQKSVFSNFTTYWTVLKNKNYLVFFAVSTFSFISFFAYISASSFILQEGYGLSPVLYSICFAINAIATGIGCALSSKFRSEKSNLIFGGTFSLVASALVALALLNHASIILLECAFVIMMFSFGCLQPVTNALALNSERKNAGTASAALGAASFLMGSIVTPVVGMGDMFRNLSLISVVGALLVFFTALYAASALNKS